MKMNRIIQGDNNRFYPQRRTGIFWGWDFFHESLFEWGILSGKEILTTDPEEAASFDTEEEAIYYISRMENKMELREIRRRQKEIRQRRGIPVKRVVKVE